MSEAGKDFFWGILAAGGALAAIILSISVPLAWSAHAEREQLTKNGYEQVPDPRSTTATLWKKAQPRERAPEKP